MSTVVGRPIFGGGFAITDGPPIPFVLPGEEIAEPASPADTPAPADASFRILKPSPERVEPRCRHFGACGGCQYQHALYPAQLAWKAAILRDLFAGAGITPPGTILTDAGEPWGYRNRIRLRVAAGAGPGTAIEFGYSRRGSNQFLPVRMCPIAAPELWAAVETLRRLSAEDAGAARLLGATGELELFTTGDAHELQITFSLRSPEVTRSEPSLFPAVCAQLARELPGLRGAGATLDVGLPRRTRRGWTDLAVGAPGLLYGVAADTFWISRRAFFQVNRFLVGTLVERVVGDAGGTLAWDLFAGAGLFSRPLARRFKRVIAVEGGDAAAADLAVAGRGAKGEPAFEAVHASILEFLQARVTSRERPELIVLDPPRSGLGRETAMLLARVRATELVYVSCDPTSLMRDLTIFVGAGYTLGETRLLDLFPQTAHMETLVRLRLRSAPVV